MTAARGGGRVGRASLRVGLAVALGQCAPGCRDDASADPDGGGSSGTNETAGPADSETGEPVVEAPEDGIGRMGMRRLSRAEYDNTIEDLLGDDTRPGVTLLPEDKKTPFDNDVANQNASRVLIEAAETLAGEISDRLRADPVRRDAVIGCTPAGADDATCFESFVRHFGRRALRRALTEPEVIELVELAEATALEGDDFYMGIDVLLRTLLQDGEFLYRIEIGTELPEQPGVYRLSGYEIATRMSYLLWGSTPSDDLLDQAEAGELDDPSERRAVAEQMLADPRSRRQLDRFHAMWLGYDELPHAPALTQAMRSETAALLERVVFDEQSSWLDLFTAQQTYIDDTLATHYGLTPPGQPAWVDYEGTERQGILSHGSFLSVAGNPGDTSPTKRGKLIRNRLLCQAIPPPPPDAEADAPPEDGECKIDRYEAHRQPGPCKGCHDQMDPIGFGLENYDLAGRFREHDEGAPQCTIEGSGELVGYGTFRGPAELSELLLDHEVLPGCIVEQVYHYAMGHALEDPDLAMAMDLEATFSDEGHRFDRLLVELVAHEAFAYRQEG